MLGRRISRGKKNPGRRICRGKKNPDPEGRRFTSHIFHTLLIYTHSVI